MILKGGTNNFSKFIWNFRKMFVSLHCKVKGTTFGKTNKRNFNNFSKFICFLNKKFVSLQSKII